MKIKEYVTAIILILIMFFMEVTELPGGLIIKIGIAGAEAIRIALVVNFLLAILLCYIAKRTLINDWEFGFKQEGMKEGVKKHGPYALIAALAVFISFLAGLESIHFIYYNSVYLVLGFIEGIVYYLGESIMQELYLRGLLQNIIERWLGGKKRTELYAVLISSVLFCIGKLPGILKEPSGSILFVIIWTVGLSIFFGAVYVKTRNLLVPIILHYLICLSALPYFSAIIPRNPAIPIWTQLICFTGLGIYGVIILCKKEPEKEE